MSAHSAQLVAHRRSIEAYIRCVVRDPDIVEEVFQLAAVAILQDTSPLFESDKDFLPWAIGVARNRCREFFRKRNTSRELATDPGVLDAFQNGLLRVLARESCTAREDALRSCLGRLGSADRKLLDEWYGGSRRRAAAIADEYGQARNWVYRQLTKVRVRLQGCVSSKLEAGPR